MRLIKVEAEFFGQYKKLGPVHFPEEGTIGILGNTGSGKSTILSAIEISLFGSIKDKKASEIKFNDAAKSQKWWVELIFELNGIQYRVVRHEVTSKAALYANGKVIQGGQTAVTEHIVDRVLKMDNVAFLNAFYAKQDEVENLNKMKNEQRKREVSKLLGMDNIDKAIQLARADKNKLNTTIEEQRRHILPDQNFTDSISECNEMIETNNKELSVVIAELSKCEKAYKDNNIVLASMEEDSKKHQALLNSYKSASNELKFITEDRIPKLTKELSELNEIESKLPALQVEVSKLDDVEGNIKVMDDKKIIYERKKMLEKRISELKTELTNQKKSMDDKKNSFSKVDFDGNLKQLNSQLLELNTEIDLANKDVLSINSDVHLIKSNGGMKREEYNTIESLGEASNCPTCQQELGEHRVKLMESLKTDITKLLSEHKVMNDKLNEKNNALSMLNTNKIKMEEAIRDIENNKSKNESLITLYNAERELYLKQVDNYHSLDKEFETLADVQFNEVEYNGLLSTRSSLLEKKNQLNVYLSKLERKHSVSQELDEVSKTKDELESKLTSLKTDGEKLDFNKDSFDKLKQDTTKLMDDIRSLEKKKLILGQNASVSMKEIERIKKDQEINGENIKLLSKRTEEFSVLLYLDEVYKNFKIDKFSKMAPSIAKIMQDLLSYLTDGKYDLVELDENYNVFVYRNNYRQPLHLFSGGEKKLISLVQRLAISRIIVSQNSSIGFDFIALDEVLGSLDNDRQQSVLEALGRLNGVFKQIIMISHNQDLNDMFDHTLQIEQNADLSSSAIWTTDWDESSVMEKII